ncbi:hypothetical protein [Candidatus Kuenenia stuttgartiensis]|uniref:hypothetical protein n=1 Tax=Kuenenia stuttgartiensis TaxID=174633 RepID=UPI00146B03B4|nr:hypothetical protein [Candidatus Kuenenia stuttgartiensis]
MHNNRLPYLASDELGRKADRHKGLQIASDYIAIGLKKSGYCLLTKCNYFQGFPFTSGR